MYVTELVITLRSHNKSIFFFIFQSAQKNHNNVIHPLNERLRIYANQLENILTVLNTTSPQLISGNPALQQLHKDLEIVKLNANWSQLLAETESHHNCNEDINAN